jgi:subtilisin family serine protease
MKTPTLLAMLALVLACRDVTEPSGSSQRQPSPRAASFGGREIIPGQYIVVFKDGVNNPESAAKKLAARYKGKLRHSYRAALKGMAVELPDSAVVALRSEPEVAYIEPNQVIRVSATTVVQTDATYGLDRIDQRNPPLSGTYSYEADGSGVRVYLIDTGIYYEHADFGGRAFFEQDMVGADGWNEGRDCNGHGTHVAGTIGGATYGVAKKVTLYSVRILNCQGVGELFYLTGAIDWITEHGVKPAVANLSVTVNGFSQAVNDALARSTAAGLTYVAAAGNSTVDACDFSPASAPSAITVAAVGQTDAFSEFSNYGSCVDLEAPGESITSDWIGSTSATMTISGTSMAAPHVTGAAALYLSTAPSSTPSQVTQALTGNATANLLTSVPAGTPNRLLYTGFLLPSPKDWISRAGLRAARSGLALGQVNGRLYAIGGRSGGTTLASVEQYNPSLDSWTGKRQLPAARWDGNGAGTINGILYLPGGKNASGTPIRTLYAYNASSNSWSTKAPLPVPSGCGGTGAIGGQLYVVTGCTSASGFAGLLHRYNPSTNTWTARAKPSVAGYPAVAAVGGKLYVAGGRNASGQPISTVQVYTPGTNTWSTLAMPGRRFGAAAFGINGKLYIVGGRESTGTGPVATMLVYDPVANSWSTSGPPMQTARTSLAAQAVGGRLYAAGGRNGSVDFKVVERFTP